MKADVAGKTIARFSAIRRSGKAREAIDTDQSYQLAPS
jgi:hypothetical protein